MTNDILAIVPARGGSKGIPRKNLLPVLGKPLIAYSIEQARASRYIRRVIVSTDDEEIAAVARAYGAEVPFMRPTAIAGDRSTDLETFQQALGWLHDAGQRCDLVVHLRPTAPARRVATIDAAIEVIARHPEAHSLRSVSRARQSPYKMWRMSGDRLEPIVELSEVREAHSLPRQQLPDVYWQNGYIDIIRPEVILTRGMMAGDHVIPYLIDEPVPELDYPEDVGGLEAVLKAMAGDEPLDRLVPPMRHAV